MRCSSLLGWHFSTGVLAHGDGRRIRRGVTHRVEGPIMACRHGLHASVRALDALSFLTSECGSKKLYVERVRLHGQVVRAVDKAVATARTYLWVAPADLILHEFACECAEASLMIGQVNDMRCWDAIAVKREWMAGKASDVQLRIARRDAWKAAQEVALNRPQTCAWATTFTSARETSQSSAHAVGIYWDGANALLESLLNRLKPRGK